MSLEPDPDATQRIQPSDATVRLPGGGAIPEGAAVDRAFRGLDPGKKIFGRYTLEVEVGRGGMGVVWRAHDDRLDRKVALKLLTESVASDPEAVRDLKVETQRCLGLHHTNIVGVYDFEQDGPTAAIVMEFVEGMSLAKRKAEAPGGCLGVSELGPLVAQLCSALDYAHAEARVVHRDLKPANLLVTPTGRVKVMDFGIARSLTETRTRLTSTSVGNTSGTLLYMSPQQLAGDKPNECDDIYALGATICELITGKPPFYRGDPHALMMQVKERKPAALAKHREDAGCSGEEIPAVWEETILACLAKEPAERPRTAGDVAFRLGLATATSTSSRAVQPRPADKPKPAVPAAQPAVGYNSRRIVLLAGIGVAALAVIVAAVLWFMPAPKAVIVTLEPAVPGAKVMIDGVTTALADNKGQVSFLNISDGAHQVSVEAQDYKIYKTPVYVTNSRGQLNFAMLSLKGSLKVSSSPPGAEVLINGVSQGTTPKMIAGQPTDVALKVELRLAGYRAPSPQTLTISAGETREVPKIDLVPESGTVVLDKWATIADSGKAVVLIGGKPRTVVDGKIEGVEAGLFSIEITLPDQTMAPFHDQVMVVDNQAVTVLAKFVKKPPTDVAGLPKAKPGQLDIPAKFAGAEVQIMDAKTMARLVPTVKVAAAMAVPVPSGTEMEVDISLPGYRLATATLSLKPDERKPLEVALVKQAGAIRPHVQVIEGGGLVEKALPGVEYFVDGSAKPWAAADGLLSGLSPGVRKISAKHPDYTTSTDQVSVQVFDNASVDATFAFTPKPAVVKVVVNGPPAYVLSVDGIETKVVDGTVTVAAGTQKVFAVYADGYDPAPPQSFTLPAHGTKEIAFTLAKKVAGPGPALIKPKPGVLEVPAKYAGAEVQVIDPKTMARLVPPFKVATTTATMPVELPSETELEIDVNLPNYRLATATLSLAATERKPLEVNLVKQAGAIRPHVQVIEGGGLVEKALPGVEYFVDGSAIAVADGLLRGLPPGERKISARHPDYTTSTDQTPVQVFDNSSVDATFTFTPKPAVVKVMVDGPSSYVLSVDGIETKVVDGAVTVAAGTQKVFAVSAEGYDAAPPQSFTLPAHGSKEITFKLEKSRQIAAASADAAVPKPGQNFTVTNPSGLKLDLIFIKPGTFQMGATEPASHPENAPKQVTITQGYWLGRTPVTQAQWKAVMAGIDNPSHFPGSELPVENVAWDQAMVFCRLLNLSEGSRLPPGFQYRLPTEAEWENACRAGQAGRFDFGDDPKVLPDNAWVKTLETNHQTHAVGLKKPNGFGLVDMLGDVAEWCFDRYADTLPGGTDPNLPSANLANNPPKDWVHAVRGAGWDAEPETVFAAMRKPIKFPNNEIGFRVALAPVSK